MKSVKWLLALALVVGIGFAIGVSCSNNGTGSHVSVGNPDVMIQNLRTESCTVKQGGAQNFNVISRCCFPATNPKIPSCWGFNPDAPYVAPYLPDADGQEQHNASGLYDSSMTVSLAYRLAENEAVVLVGKTPPPVTYFSYVPYLFIRYSQELGRYVRIFATMTDTINHRNIKTSGTPDGSGDDPFDKDTVVIVTADRNTDRLVRRAAVQAGYSESIINTLIIPSEIARMGLEAGKDEFVIFNRLALPPEDEASKKKFNDYLSAPGIRAFRVTPNEGGIEAFATPAVTARASGANENSMTDSVVSLRRAILSQYAAYTAKEHDTKIWIPEGRDCIASNMECIGENHDTVYLRMPGSTTDYPVSGPELFTLSENADEFAIVYGVNHVATGKATYHSISAYGNDRLNGLVTLTHRSFTGSAAKYLPNDPNANKLYVAKVARHCSADETDPCMEIPAGGCPVDDLTNYGSPADAKLFLVIRAYVDPATNVGPSPEEILFDRTIHMTRG